ncbi:hypothetical protein GY21_18800 [Cryobacterium roopkundense]|nr:SDR family NAD(P)-dependent oxidoreductase [Cryobacterium roopkundense]KGJ71934.1 hypothetical protein GY21_18800 [Cryobacterium roopkundense]
MSHTTESSSSAPNVALITGTSSGIGLAVSIAAARAGWSTVATLRDPESAEHLGAAAAAAGVELDIQVLDITRPETITAVLDHIASASDSRPRRQPGHSWARSSRTSMEPGSRADVVLGRRLILVI